MPYQAEISRDNPTCLLFVIDQSGSMGEKTESGRSKAHFVADVLNKTLYTLVTTPRPTVYVTTSTSASSPTADRMCAPVSVMPYPAASFIRSTP